ncbi:metallophosphoesterase [uncultured Microbacterium sp.]|uniref:metallophosphoesterase n=1 Tax=uncultured Microbacterium sp. TaxID=191216 RepID=UPI0026204E6D|nr:metallophosphoesterase [uncultured Microbacterium sp.]
MPAERGWFDFDAVDFVTSDHHFGHARISELAGRPFSTVDEMDSALIERWNSVVPTDAVVLHLGDVALGPINDSVALTAQLNGRRHLVPGNHDRVSSATQSRKAIERFAPIYEAAGWVILPEIIEGTRRGHRLMASHYPYWGDSQEIDRHSKHRPIDKGIPLLHGHTHSRDHGPDGNQFHVGVDAFEFRPVAMGVIDRWLGGEHSPTRVEIPNEVAALLHRLYRPEAAAAWLCGHNSHLVGARPIDLLKLNEIGDVVDALNSEVQGGMS